jgi:hypothetical protein
MRVLGLVWLLTQAASAGATPVTFLIGGQLPGCAGSSDPFVGAPLLGYLTLDDEPQGEARDHYDFYSGSGAPYGMVLTIAGYTGIATGLGHRNRQ